MLRGRPRAEACHHGVATGVVLILSHRCLPVSQEPLALLLVEIGHQTRTDGNRSQRAGGGAADAQPPVWAVDFLACSRKVAARGQNPLPTRSEEHTSELQSLMRISYAVFCLKKNN